MSNSKFAKNCNLQLSIRYSNVRPVLTRNRSKGRTEQHKILIRPKQLVLITPQKKGSAEKLPL